MLSVRGTQLIEPKTWWRDYTGRFKQRPFYEDAAMEAAASALAREHIGDTLKWPLTDDDLDTLADFSTASFDRGRDMSALGFEADAVTIFSQTGLPKMILSDALSTANMRLRRRMTIAHELGHIVLHQPLYGGDHRQLDLLSEYRAIPAYCHEAMSKATVDWCEWQASYFGGALLAPRAEIPQVLGEAGQSADSEQDGTVRAIAMIAKIAKHFQISRDAARVRLAQIGLIIPAGTEVLPIADSA